MAGDRALDVLGRVGDLGAGHGGQGLLEAVLVEDPGRDDDLVGGDAPGRGAAVVALEDDARRRVRVAGDLLVAVGALLHAGWGAGASRSACSSGFRRGLFPSGASCAARGLGVRCRFAYGRSGGRIDGAWSFAYHGLVGTTIGDGGGSGREILAVHRRDEGRHQDKEQSEGDKRTVPLEDAARCGRGGDGGRGQRNSVRSGDDDGAAIVSNAAVVRPCDAEGGEQPGQPHQGRGPTGRTGDRA